MPYRIVGMIALLALLAVLAWAVPTSAVEVWTPPEECADEDRVQPGNRLTPCLYVAPELTSVEYRVDMEYPYCVEKVTYRLPGIGPWPDRPDGSIPGHFRYRGGWDYHWTIAESYDAGDRFVEIGVFLRDTTRLLDGAIEVTGRRWELDAPVGGTHFISGESVRLKFNVKVLSNLSNTGSFHDTGDHIQSTSKVPYPDVSTAVDKANDCLRLVLQEKQDREHKAELARQATHEAQRIQVTQDAVRKEQQQAEREATAQAVQATQEVRAILEDQLEIARTELIKTQTLAAELEHKEVVAELVREIIRIRLAGQEDRARLVNEHLARTELAEAEFEAETAEIEARIQKYLDFNAELLAKIESYQTAVKDRLTSLRQTLAEQQALIEELEAEAQDIARTEEEEVP